MIREEYLRRLVNEAYCEIYLSANDGARIYWPWRMQPPKEASDTYRNACERYVIDSDPLDETVDAQTVLDTAHQTDAEVASLQDVYQDKDGTVNQLLHDLEVADDHPFDGELLLPLQDPFVECWQELGEPRDHWIGLGGLKDASDKERVRAARTFDRASGGDLHVHGFGWGPREDIVTAIHDKPSIIDSIDYSSPCRSTPIDVSPGEEIMSVQAAYAGARLVSDLRKLTPYPEIETEGIQAGVGDF